MKLYLLNNENISICDISSKIEKSFSFDYKYNELTKVPITLEKNNEDWFLKSNNFVNVFQNNMVVPSIKLVEYGSYYLKINNVDSLVLMYVLPSVEQEIYDLECQQIPKITIGSDPMNHIHYPNELILPNHCEIIRLENEVKLNVTDTQAKVFVNNKRITSCSLKTGDIIFIHGLKIIWMNSFIRINNPKKMVRIQGFNFYNNNIDNSIYEL